jgi:hypothetical protein
MTGVVTIVQEGRFQLTDDGGVSHLFLLSAMAALEPGQLRALQRDQARVSVQYTAAANVIGSTATTIAEERPAFLKKEAKNFWTFGFGVSHKRATNE